MKIYRYFLFILINMSAMNIYAQSRLMTIDEVDSIAIQRNMMLKASKLDVDIAEGELSQAKKYVNPEVQVMHNIQNPENRKWFDIGYEGQTDIQLSQPIAIGGQYKNKVRQAKAIVKASKAAYDVEVLNVRQEARMAFIDLYNAQQKLKVFNKELASVEKIHKAYEVQTEKGNISKIETFRIATMLNQLRSERTELQLSINYIQKKLRLMLCIEDDTEIEAQMDEEKTIGLVVNALAQLQQASTPAGSTLLKSIIENHPELAQAKYQEESAQHAIKAEKAEALPQIAINGEWDKNGSIGHNFFAIGATISVPLWNRNQGNIRSAKAQYEQASLNRQQRQKELHASLMANYQATLQQLQLVEKQKKQLSANIDQLLTAAEEQFLKRNISVIEFVDLYDSYRDANFMIEDGKAQLMKSYEELKKYTR